jgi:hypothetical protein
MYLVWFLVAVLAGAVAGVVGLVAYCTQAMHGSDDIA